MSYIIAEIGSNHGGSMGEAVRLIKSAKECGCNAVKFQSWTPTSLYAREYLETNPDFFADLARLYLPAHKFKRLALVAHGLDLKFVCSVFSKEEADAIEDFVDSYKIASMDLNNIDLIKHVAKKRKPMIVSTGMGAPDEISAAVMTARACPLTVLHCVSLYPCPLAKANLGRIEYYKRLLDKQAINVGFSDHTVGAVAACAAVAKGAWMIEKHFTLDKTQDGWDHAYSADPQEMTEIVEKCREVQIACQHSREEDFVSRDTMRRSLVSSKALKKGTRLKDRHIVYRRPGTGYGLGDDITGKELAVDVVKGHVFTREDFE